MSGRRSTPAWAADLLAHNQSNRKATLDTRAPRAFEEDDAHAVYARHLYAAISEGMCPHGHGRLRERGACYRCEGDWHLDDRPGTTHWCRFGHCNHDRDT